MNGESLRILLIEDDPHLALLVKTNLEMDGYLVKVCADGVDGLNSFQTEPFHLCLLDVMLPKQDGFKVASAIRSKSQVPVIFITAKALKEDIYKGFEIGGDDYITKPFTIRELQLRIKAVLKRSRGHHRQSNEVFAIGSLNFNYNLRQITGDGKTKTLSTKESELLRIFCENPNMVVNRSKLLVEVWGNDDYFVSKSLDVYITKLRKLLMDDATISLQNYHSVGYKLVVAPPQ